MLNCELFLIKRTVRYSIISGSCHCKLCAHSEPPVSLQSRLLTSLFVCTKKAVK